MMFMRALALLFFAFLGQAAIAQGAAEPQSEAKPPAIPLTIESLGWLEGCWRGAVNQREFREYWLPLRGGIIVGAGHTVMQDKTQDFEYMRIEARPDGVYYVVAPSGKREASFKLTAISEADGTDFVFVNGADEYPQRMIYHRGAEGWLYATIDGKINGEERKVVYPMRRIVCESGEVVKK